jgi:hypothetical protein
MKINIAPSSPDLKRPYLHLYPLVKFLLENGNKLDASNPKFQPNEFGFYRDRDGWISDMQYPINFNLIKENFNLPPTIHLSEEHHGIFCHLSWNGIIGPKT